MPAVMKTPGVYIVEESAFPSSVVEVATAVPAFIGYTEKADNQGRSLANRPWRITSMSEYHAYFGGAPKPLFRLSEPGAGQLGAEPESPSEPEPPPTPADAEGAEPAEGGEASAPEAEPAEEAKAGGNVQTAAAPEVAAFSFGGRGYTLTQQGSEYLFYYSMRLFFQNGGGPCYIVSVGVYGDDIDAGRLSAGIELLVKEQEPTMVVIPEVVRLSEQLCITVQQAMLTHCGARMKNRFAILDVYNGYRDRQHPEGDCIDNFRSALGVNNLDFAAAYYPWVNTTMVRVADLSYENIPDPSKALLQAVLREELGLPADGSADATDVQAVQQAEAINDITKDWTQADAQGVVPTAEEAQAGRALLDKVLKGMGSQVYGSVLTEIRDKLNLLPPAAAMAGVYTAVDNARGVWKAPANVSLNAVVSPAVNITNDEQEDLNVTVQGKSINAIRPFTGEGVLVWGGRTLDGNSLDWRYVQVRRTIIMLEESIKLAAKAYVFENNTANTWVTIKSTIRNFLTGIWKRGGLAGASPDDAFAVFVGLGETMTPTDILEGILRVTVLVALIRPAEFIEITFQQQMQQS